MNFGCAPCILHRPFLPSRARAGLQRGRLGRHRHIRPARVGARAGRRLALVSTASTRPPRGQAASAGCAEHAGKNARHDELARGPLGRRRRPESDSDASTECECVLLQNRHFLCRLPPRSGALKRSVPLWLSVGVALHAGGRPRCHACIARSSSSPEEVRYGGPAFKTYCEVRRNSYRASWSPFCPLCFCGSRPRRRSEGRARPSQLERVRLFSVWQLARVAASRSKACSAMPPHSFRTQPRRRACSSSPSRSSLSLSLSLSRGRSSLIATVRPPGSRDAQKEPIPRPARTIYERTNVLPLRARGRRRQLSLLAMAVGATERAGFAPARRARGKRTHLAVLRSPSSTGSG